MDCLAAATRGWQTLKRSILFCAVFSRGRSRFRQVPLPASAGLRGRSRTHSRRENGTQPYWPNSIFRVYIRPAAKKIGLTKRIGWHTFRHTFGTILNANGENPKVIQELLRHANLKVTMDTYVQPVTDEKHNAQSKVVKMLLPGVRKREAV